MKFVLWLLSWTLFCVVGLILSPVALLAFALGAGVEVNDRRYALRNAGWVLRVTTSSKERE